MDNDQFIRDGQPYRILSGSIHYARVHPDDWDDRLQRMRALGLNTIETCRAITTHALSHTHTHHHTRARPHTITPSHHLTHTHTHTHHHTHTHTPLTHAVHRTDVPWNWHNAYPNAYDFTGSRDVVKVGGPTQGGLGPEGSPSRPGSVGRAVPAAGTGPRPPGGAATRPLCLR
jgi:hypothetical protein